MAGLSRVIEGARDGRSIGELMENGRRVLPRAHVMDGVPEGPRRDGRKLVTLHEPVT